MNKIEDTRILYFDETITIHKKIWMKKLPKEYHHKSIEELKKLYNEDDSRLKWAIISIEEEYEGINHLISGETKEREKITHLSGEIL
jgi:hypothetical protein